MAETQLTSSRWVSQCELEGRACGLVVCVILAGSPVGPQNPSCYCGMVVRLSGDTEARSVGQKATHG